MEDKGNTEAAGEGTQRAADAAEKISASDPQPKKRRGRAKAAEPQPEQQPAQEQSVIFVIDAKDLKKAIAPFLRGVAVASKTSPPSSEEVDGIGEGVAVGLRHTKFAVNPNTGPWVPLMIAVTFYAVPRVIEAVTNYANRKEGAAKAENDPKQLDFWELDSGAVPLDAEPSQAPTSTNGDGPVKAVGAKGG